VNISEKKLDQVSVSYRKAVGLAVYTNILISRYETLTGGAGCALYEI
jgi:hypothetical protein